MELKRKTRYIYTACCLGFASRILCARIIDLMMVHAYSEVGEEGAASAEAAGAPGAQAVFKFILKTSTNRVTLTQRTPCIKARRSSHYI